MLIKGLIAEDFLQYKKPSMVVLFPKCSFKCDKECGSKVCQNSELALAPSIDVEIPRIVEQYTDSQISQAICFGGLEPFDSFDDMLALVKEIRSVTDDDIVIYTGYYNKEIGQYVYNENEKTGKFTSGLYFSPVGKGVNGFVKGTVVLKIRDAEVYVPIDITIPAK